MAVVLFKLFFGRRVAVSRAIAAAVAVLCRRVGIRRGSCGCFGELSPVGGAMVRSIARVLPAQLLVHGLLGKPEYLADSVQETLGLLQQAGVQFDLQVDAGSARSVVVVGDLAAEADVGYERYVITFLFWGGH